MDEIEQLRAELKESRRRTKHWKRVAGRARNQVGYLRKQLAEAIRVRDINTNLMNMESIIIVKQENQIAELKSKL